MTVGDHRIEVAVAARTSALPARKRFRLRPEMILIPLFAVFVIGGWELACRQLIVEELDQTGTGRDELELAVDSGELGEHGCAQGRKTRRIDRVAVGAEGVGGEGDRFTAGMGPQERCAG